MNKLIIAGVSAIALMGLAACSDTDDNTTQSVPDQMQQDQVQPLDEAPGAAPIAPTEPTTPPVAPPATPPAE